MDFLFLSSCFRCNYVVFKRLSNRRTMEYDCYGAGNQHKMNVLNNAAGYLVAVLYYRCMGQTVRIV